MDTTIAPSPVTAGILDITSWERLPAALRRSLATLARECGPTGIPAITTCFVWGGGAAYSAMVGKHEARTFSPTSPPAHSLSTRTTRTARTSGTARRWPRWQRPPSEPRQDAR